MYYDIFNGDADGIFAFHQYRLKFPVPSSQRITGVKRDIRLLEKVVNVNDAVISVFDISLNSNRTALETLLSKNNRIIYFDHHFAGKIPEIDLLDANINPSPDICTSLIVNKFLEGAYWKWAVCGAFGDNLHISAHSLAKANGLTQTQTELLKELGELFNYNGYGADLSDLHYHPDQLYKIIQPFTDPLDFLESSSEVGKLREGHASDMEHAMSQKKMAVSGENRIYMFPNSPWARRVTGVFSNLRAREKTGAAHAIISTNSDTTLRISVRAPLDDKRDADTLCNSFPTGGGRAAAAGINHLPEDQLDSFIEAFQNLYKP